MRRVCGILTILVLTFTTASSALAYSVVGIVTNQDQKFVNDVWVTVTNAQGQEVGHGRTDLYGRYCIPVEKTGKVTLSLDPGKTQYLGGSTIQTVDIEGLTVNWHVSPLKPAQTTSNVGVASAAAVTCGGAYWTTATAAALGVAGTGGLIGGIIAGTSGGGGGPTVKSASK